MIIDSSAAKYTTKCYQEFGCHDTYRVVQFEYFLQLLQLLL